jgi:hypothetical protein
LARLRCAEIDAVYKRLCTGFCGLNRVHYHLTDSHGAAANTLRQLLAPGQHIRRD